MSTVTPEEQARDQDLRKANALLGHWMGGIYPCTCWRCQDVAAALRTAREEGMRMAADQVAGYQGYTSGRCQPKDIAEAIRARAQESEG